MNRPDVSSGTSDTPWLSSATRPLFPLLDEDIEVDVAIIGGGITGLSVAYFLSREGRSVAVIEDGVIGSGETGRTTAHLASALDDRFHRLEQLHGEQGTRLAYESHAAAIDAIEGIVRRHKIDCDFARVPGYLFGAPDSKPDELEQEFEACRRIRFKGVGKVERAPFADFDTGAALLFPDQAQFHPLKYLAALAEAVVRQGGRIYERSHVEDYEVGERIKIAVRTKGAVLASAMVVATNAPIVSMVKLPLKQFAYRSYVVALDAPKGSLPKALYWDTADPYHYLRVQQIGSHELLIAGGEDHLTGQPGKEDGDERYARLEAWTRERVPSAGKVRFRWSGQVMEPADGLAFIGRYPKLGDNVYVATGDSGHGLTHGTIAGILLRDLILRRENEWTSVYDPGRVTLRSAGTQLAGDLKAARQYGKWLTAGDVKTPDEVERGEGCVLRRGFKKMAAYRDERGQLHTMSAVCPHLGGIVVWNNAEKTWDCPCHGSRFSATGEVLNGPANSPLESLRKPAAKPKPRAKESDRKRPA